MKRRLGTVRASRSSRMLDMVRVNPPGETFLQNKVWCFKFLVTTDAPSLEPRVQICYFPENKLCLAN